VKAQLPLREAAIEVQEIPGKPGAYRAIAFLKPTSSLMNFLCRYVWLPIFPLQHGSN